tara:strand:+ start:4694 stop:6025 length:1332 start_codon:yes stop_codon:yes gene_type:complete
MSTSHRTNRLKLESSPSVEKLQNDRFRLIFSARPINQREDWYNANKARIFADFGSLQSAEMSVDGIAARTGEAYSDMRLVAIKTVPDALGFLVEFTYETLGSAFVQVKDDTVELEENGLRKVTRISIAQAGTDIPADDKNIGVHFINHQIDSEVSVRCFLSSYEVNDTDSFREFSRTYIEAGTLSQTRTNLSNGVYRQSTEFLVTEGSVTGPIVSRRIGNFNGLKTITVDTLQQADGSTIIDDSNPVHEYKVFKSFQYPGIMDITARRARSVGNDLSVQDKILQAPAQANVLCTAYVFFTSSNQIQQSDYTYQSAQGLWSPNNWASFSLSIFSDLNPFFISKGFRGYRTDSESRSVASSQILFDFPSVTYNGSVKASGQVGTIFTNIDVTSKGPPDPIGKKWVLSVDVVPALDDINGTTTYKKTIVVTDAIPAQLSTATLPYT